MGGLKNSAISCLIAAFLVFWTFAATSYLYSLIVHDRGVADWEGAVRFSLVMGMVLGGVIPRINRDRT